MSRNFKSIVIFLAILVIGVFIKFTFFPNYKGPEMIEDPIQGEMNKQVIEHLDYNGNYVDITLMASYEGSFAIKGVKKYSTDGASSVSQRDFVLTWGRLPEEEVNKEIAYSQRNRWYYYSYTGSSLVTGKYIATHSANCHMIPATESVKETIHDIKENDYVFMKGYLVVVNFDDGNWKSSLTREDTGDGSCEIFYVTEIIEY